MTQRKTYSAIVPQSKNVVAYTGTRNVRYATFARWDNDKSAGNYAWQHIGWSSAKRYEDAVRAAKSTAPYASEYHATPARQHD